MTNAEGNSSAMREPVTTGKEGIGRPRGSAPYCEAIVETGMTASATTTETSTVPTSRSGTRGNSRRIAMIATSVAMPAPSAAQLVDPRAAHNAAILGRKSAGRSDTWMPAKSLSWLAAMMIAMPMVKPLTTASGT